MRVIRSLVLAAGFLATAASPALADVTLFLGSTSTPSARQARGFAFGGGILVLGFEFEYSDTRESVEDAAPSLRTGMGNILLQTPVAIAGFQPYFTTGFGGYRESFNGESETQLGGNAGGGVKVRLAGPLRARFDYRVFRLRGEPLHDVVHRIYVGANLAF
jgi:hypothetical protein